MQIHGRLARVAARALVACLALSFVAAPLSATWSIVVVDTRTGEVAVGTATCLLTLDIQELVPVLVPGHGAGASQSKQDTGALSRGKMFRGLQVGASPDEILAALALQPAHGLRQYGIVDLLHEPVTFTGLGTGAASGGVSGTLGDLRYAIQGNVLTGPEVWLAAEAALLATPGDLSQRLMAAMEAARSFGGDGRCSCDLWQPTSCGAPPAGGFNKSAHIGYVGVARIGDGLGVCNGVVGCANGDYFLSLNHTTNFGPDPDPVFVLQAKYDAWRQGQQGRPDQVWSTVEARAQALVADGQSSTRVDVALADIERVPLSSGGLQVELQRLSPGAAVTTPSAVTDNGDGTYSFFLSAGSTPGADVWRVLVTDAAGTVVLQPDVAIAVDALVPLHLGSSAVSAAQGGQVAFTLNLGPSHAGQPYFVLGSAAGTQPSSTFQGLTVPLNADRLLELLTEGPPAPLFDGMQGLLDESGRASAYFQPAPGQLAPLAGGHLDWAAVVLGPQPSVLGPVGLDVSP